MRSIFVIARNTVSEALSRIILQVILVFAIMFLVIGFFFTYMTPGEEDKMLKDLGLTVITVFGLLIAIFMGMSLVQPEVERRTIYALLAKPVRRIEFLLGKYLGALVVLALCLLIMGAVLVVALYLKQQIWSPQLFIALIGTFLSLMIMTALVLMISTFASSLMAVVSGFLFWSVGYGQIYIKQLAEHADNPVSQWALLAMNVILPNFMRLDQRLAVVDGIPISTVVIGLMAGYAVLYTVVVIAIAAVLFYEREM
ncbi:MAG: ABC transporter permease subunit [Armatimonadota bacterium]|nr:MAG: ABC transporter permease subunit [Armatimonadota bacterium]